MMSSLQEHPRVHGATFTGIRPGGHPRGASPRTRGDLYGHQTRWSPTRSIPAYTGRPLRASDQVVTHEEHPRVHGATAFGSKVGKPGPGASPRTRGDRAMVRGQNDQSGSIPAYTGRPDTAEPVATAPREHPRVHGATPRASVTVCSCRGASPRTRGDPAS